ncbi:hypothetical protein Hamer_G014100 [Homarus americanus]|uniref:Uncharacterized protein n=1 Tax=Homarus americanus TaxID=6706 RepID=A0A8J5JY48_HOMAM|nr:hypothetical protein Hamer_G014100 [Homarus americanus]
MLHPLDGWSRGCWLCV